MLLGLAFERVGEAKMYRFAFFILFFYSFTIYLLVYFGHVIRSSVDSSWMGIVFIFGSRCAPLFFCYFFLHDIKDLVAGVVGLCVSGFQEARFPFVSEHF